jgi:hypothetical protein
MGLHFFGALRLWPALAFAANEIHQTQRSVTHIGQLIYGNFLAFYSVHSCVFMGVRMIQNARIVSAFLGFEHHGILTANLQLDLGRGSQGFGGYRLDGGQINACAIFIRGVLTLLECEHWGQLVGKNLRVKGDGHSIQAIGHIINDNWFDPAAEFERAKSNA